MSKMLSEFVEVCQKKFYCVGRCKLTRRNVGEGGASTESAIAPFGNLLRTNQ